MPFLNISTIVIDSFPELDFDTCEDGEHFTAVLNHETFPIEDLEYAINDNSKSGMNNP